MCNFLGDIIRPGTLAVGLGANISVEYLLLPLQGNIGPFLSTQSVNITFAIADEEVLSLFPGSVERLVYSGLYILGASAFFINCRPYIVRRDDLCTMLKLG